MPKQQEYCQCIIKESNFKVSGNQDINVYNLSISIPDIVRSFVQEGVDVMDAHLCEDTLEDYFKKSDRRGRNCLI